MIIISFYVCAIAFNDHLAHIQSLREAAVHGMFVSVNTKLWQHVESTLLNHVAYDNKYDDPQNDGLLTLRYMIPQNVSLISSIPLKRRSQNPNHLLLGIDQTFFVVYNGKERLLNYDLGREVINWDVPQQVDRHVITMMDATGHTFSYNLRIRVSNTNEMSCSLEPMMSMSVDNPLGGEHCTTKDMKPTAGPVTFEKDGLLNILVGDETGRITQVQNGTRKGSVTVVSSSEWRDHGEETARWNWEFEAKEEAPTSMRIRGLRHAGSLILWWTSWKVGLLTTHMDVPWYPCTGWTSPVIDAVMDNSKLIVSLEDGSLLIYSTVRGKAKLCELMHKYPRIGPKTDTVVKFRGHLFRLAGRHLSIINQSKMEKRNGGGIRLFASNFARAFTIIGGQLVAVDEDGISVYDIHTAHIVESVAAEEGGGWGFDSIPRYGVFGVLIICAVIWNIRNLKKRKDAEDEAMREEVEATVPENFSVLEERINKMQSAMDDFETTQDANALASGLSEFDD